jgi:hypothetical protein
VKPKLVEGMSLEEFDSIANNAKEELLVIEFKKAQDSVSCIPANSLNNHKHLMCLISHVFDVNSPLVKKFGI